MDKGKFSDDGDEVFVHAPCLYFSGGKVAFDTYDVSGPLEHYGSASGRLPQ